MTDTVVFVGTTAEMGRVICEQLLAADYDVLAVARNAEALGAMAEQLAGLRVCQADIVEDDATHVISGQLTHAVRPVIHGPGVPTAGG